jgi:predicted transcriptional regulator
MRDTTQRLHNRIVDNIKTQCASAGLTLEELAERARVPVGSLRRRAVVHGMRLDAMTRIARALRIDPARLVRGPD